jgi:hypothetical protein
MADPLKRVERAAEALRTRERAVDAARDELQAAMLAAWKAGKSKSAISRAAGVSRQWVGKLVE